MSKDEINVDLFDEVKRLQEENNSLKTSIAVNINDYVKVKLNDLGVSVLKEKHDNLNKMIHARGGNGLGEFELKVDEDGYTKFPLWDLMNIFGHLMVMGFEVPFETDIIFTRGNPITK